MDIERQKIAPLPSVKRLPLYLGYLREIRARGRELVSCTHIAEALCLDSVQVRKDLTVTGIIGKPKVGYRVSILIDVIEKFLGWNNLTGAFLVGVGNLGRAFLGYNMFRENGLEIVAAFDVATEKIGTTIQGKEVFHTERLAELAKKMNVQIALLAVPAAAAQEAASLLVAAGMKGIINLAPTKLDIPNSVIVENVNIAASWAAISSRLVESQMLSVDFKQNKEVKS